MNIIFTRDGARTRMICRRVDGTFAAADLGPSLPGHDFAHLIVERTLRLSSGFFANIAKGFSIQDLSDASVIRSLGAEPYVAEILARALGSLATGACTLEQFPDLVATELGQMRLTVPEGVSVESATLMLEELRSLMTRFSGLAPGESLELKFGESAQAH